MTDSPSSLPLSTSSSSLPGGTLGGVDSDRSNDDPSLLSAFMALVLAEYAKFEDGPRLTEGLNKTFNSVYADAGGAIASEFSALLGRALDASAVRRLLFDPVPAQAFHYPPLLTGSSPRMQKILLSVIYLRHRKSWEFLKCFILADGLVSLIPLIVDDNLYARGQAVELLLSVTDCDVFDWFGADETSIEHQALFYRLFHTIQHKHFLRNLFENRATSYPGGSYNCLQLVAFALSWIRTTYAPAKKIRLHENIMGSLLLWSQPSADACGDGACEHGSDADHEDTQPPEIKLAQTLLEDFGREPTIPNDENSFLFAFTGVVTPSNFSDDSIVKQVISNMKASLIPNSASDLRTPEELKDEGNKQYKDHNYLEAYKLFQLATSRLPDTETASPLAIALWFNLATVHWKFAELCEESLLNGPSRGADCVCCDVECHNAHESDARSGAAWEVRRLDHLRASERLSTKVIDKSGSMHIKAIFRKASCLLALGSPKMAYDVVDQAIEILRRQDTLGIATDKSSDADSITLLKGVQRRCMAALLTKDESLLQTATSLSAVTITAAGEVADTSSVASDVVLSGLSELSVSDRAEKPMNNSTASILIKLRARASGFDANNVPTTSAPHAVAQSSDAPTVSHATTPTESVKPVSQRLSHTDAASLISVSPAPLDVSAKARVAAKKDKGTLASKTASSEHIAIVKKHVKTLKAELSKNSCSMEEMKKLFESFASSRLRLADVVGEGMDESLLLAMLRIATNASAAAAAGEGGENGIDTEFIREYLVEVSRCSRFETQLRFAAFGDSQLQARVVSLIEKLPNQEGLQAYFSVLNK